MVPHVISTCLIDQYILNTTIAGSYSPLHTCTSELGSIYIYCTEQATYSRFILCIELIRIKAVVPEIEFEVQ